MLEVRLFGKGEVNYNSKSMAGSPSHCPFMLLSYLMLNRVHPQNREHISANFWPEASARTARKRLRNAIWRLRLDLHEIGVELNGLFIITNEYVSFVQTSDVSIDVELFENSIISYRGIPGSQLTSDQASQLEAAAALYTGDLLEGVYKDWCISERERLRLLDLDALYKLMSFHRYHDNFEKGLAYGRQILQLDPTRENVHCQMMMLYWLAGDRNSAMAQYHLCCQILRDELGLEPLKSTRLLYERFLHDQFDKEQIRNIDLSEDTEATRESHHVSSEHILQELHRLQVIIDGAWKKSRLLEQLIEESLTKPETQPLK